MRVARVLAAVAATVTFAAAFFMTIPAPVQAAGPRVAIIVGPVGSSLTPMYIEWANETAAAATAAGATVVKAYSPNATASKVLAAVAGANMIIYYGHGSGFPNPYSTTLDTSGTNGWGLQGPNAKGTHEDSWSNGTLKYYGEAWIAANAKPAPGFTMIYSNACYAPGASEPGHTNATESVAKTRVGYYSRAPLNMGAGAYFATDLGAASLVTKILTSPSTTFGDIFKSYHGYSASALRTFAHPHVSGRQVWIQKSANWSGEADYWYAFAGDPSRTPSGGRDSTAPALAGRSPVVNATNVPLNQVVQAQFSEPVTGVTTASFAVRDTTTWTLLPATVSYNATTKVASLRTSVPMVAGHQHRVVLTSSIKDASGNALPWTSWYFTTTTDATAPTLLGRAPLVDAVDVPLNQVVQAQFSEQVTGLTTATFGLRDTTTWTLVPATVTYDPTTMVASLRPSAPLASGHEHRVTATSGIKDATGNALAWTTWNFTAVTVDEIAPTVVGRSPLVNVTNVSTSHIVQAQFSEPVVGVTSATFGLRDTTTWTLIPATVTYDPTTRIASLRPSIALVPGHAHRVTLTSGITDTAGNTLAWTTWNFTTAL